MMMGGLQQPLTTSRSSVFFVFLLLFADEVFVSFGLFHFGVYGLRPAVIFNELAHIAFWCTQYSGILVVNELGQLKTLCINANDSHVDTHRFEVCSMVAPPVQDSIVCATVVSVGAGLNSLL